MTRRRRQMSLRHRAGTRVFYETRGSSPRPRDRSDRAFAACARDGIRGGSRGEGARVGGVRREVQSRGDDARCRRTRVVETRRASIRGKRKWPTGDEKRAADRVCDATVGGGTETMGRRVWKCRARESVRRRVPVAFRSSTTSNPKPRSRETPCLARCGAHAPADGRAMWAAVVYKSWSTGMPLKLWVHSRLLISLTATYE